MTAGGFRRVVVLSDCHFGETNALLARREVVEGLLSELEGLGGVDVLILLGDIWDLWRTGLEDAGTRGSSFFEALGEWRGKTEVVLVAGNHDAGLSYWCEERKTLDRMGWSMSPATEGTSLAAPGGCRVDGTPADLSRPPGPEEKAVPLTGAVLAAPGLVSRCGLSLEGLEMSLCYPFLTIEVSGRTFLFMHGHHLDYFSRSFWWAKTAWLARWVLRGSPGTSISDIDRLNRPFFELLGSTAAVPELREREYRFYAALRLLARLFRFQTGKGASPRRYTSVGENAGEAEEMLLEMLPGFIPDALVFGHTHRAGLEHVEVGATRVLMANCGCWLEDEEATAATYIVIDDAVRLRRLGDWEIAVALPG